METTLIIGLYIACEIIANVTASKPLLLPGNIIAPAAVFIYAITFTLIDLINESMGKDGARRVVYTAFLANLLLAAYSQFTIRLPAAPFYVPGGQAAFAQVLGSTWRVVLASLSAYVISSLIDIQVFAWWRQRVGRLKWLRVLTSNAISTFVDSIVFIALAFYGIMPVWPLIMGQYVVKMLVTVMSIPLIYAVRSHMSASAAEASRIV